MANSMYICISNLVYFRIVKYDGLKYHGLMWIEFWTVSSFL